MVVAAKSDMYKRSVVYRGEFKNGTLEGDCDVIVTDKMLTGKIEEQTEVHTYKTMF